MPSVLAIISKAVFEKDHGRGVSLGAVLPLAAYHSKNPSLESLTEGGDLHLVTVREGALWLVAVLRRPRFDGAAWVAARNVVPIADVTDALPRLRFANGKGIDVPPEKLGMALQTPRALTDADVAVLEAARAGRKASRAPAPAPAPKKPAAPAKAATKPPATAADSSRIDRIIAGRMEQAIGAIRELTAGAGPSVADEILPWVDLDKWRSTEATSFWVYTYFLLMRFGEAKHVKALRRPSPHKSFSQMHEWLKRNRKLTADVIELRAAMKPRTQTWTDEPIPKSRAQVMAHIAKRLGDPRWKPGKALVALAAKPSFSLHGEEGLHVFAALLLHGEPEELAALKGLAKQEPIFAQILAAHGRSGASPAGAGPDRGESLRRAVLEDPASDDLRAVYADWLMEEGDPRGEMIAAQLAGKPTKIDDKSALAWAGEVRAKLRWRAPFANEKPFHVPRYARGFLSGAAVDSLDGQTAASADWATLEVLDVHGKNIDRIGDYDLRSLVVLGGLSEKNLEAVLGRPELVERLVGIGVQVDRHDRGEVWDRLASFPNLRFLAVGRGGALASLLAHPLMKRLEVLAINQDTRLPKAGREHVTLLGTYLHPERWLVHYDVLRERFA